MKTDLVVPIDERRVMLTLFSALMSLYIGPTNPRTPPTNSVAKRVRGNVVEMPLRNVVVMPRRYVKEAA